MSPLKSPEDFAFSPNTLWGAAIQRSYSAALSPLGLSRSAQPSVQSTERKSGNAFYSKYLPLGNSGVTALLMDSPPAAKIDVSFLSGGICELLLVEKHDDLNFHAQVSVPHPQGCLIGATFSVGFLKRHRCKSAFNCLPESDPWSHQYLTYVIINHESCK